MNRQEEYAHKLAHMDLQSRLNESQRDIYAASRTAPVGMPVTTVTDIDRSGLGDCASGIPAQIATTVTRLDDETLSVSNTFTFDDGEESSLGEEQMATYEEVFEHFGVLMMQDLMERMALKAEYDPDEADADIFEADRGISL